MSQETTYQLQEKEKRINHKHHLDACSFRDSHDEHDDVGWSVPSSAK